MAKVIKPKGLDEKYEFEDYKFEINKKTKAEIVTGEADEEERLSKLKAELAKLEAEKNELVENFVKSVIEKVGKNDGKYSTECITINPTERAKNKG